MESRLEDIKPAVGQLSSAELKVLLDEEQPGNQTIPVNYRYSGGTFQ